MLNRFLEMLKEAKFWKRFHAAAAVFFAIQIPIALLTSWKDSVPYLVFLSLWALVGAHWGAWQAAHVEEKEDKKMS